MQERREPSQATSKLVNLLRIFYLLTLSHQEKDKLLKWKGNLKFLDLMNLSHWKCSQNGQEMRRLKLMTSRLDLRKMRQLDGKSLLNQRLSKVLDKSICHQVLIISLKVNQFG
jgi:hypothetical protein